MKKSLFSAFVLVYTVLTASAVYALAPWTGNAVSIENKLEKSNRVKVFNKAIVQQRRELEDEGTFSRLPYVQAPPYILPNEPEPGRVIEQLKNYDKPQGDALNCHIGVSGLFNYDVVAARKSDFALLIDINKNTVALHWLTIMILQDTKIHTRQQFIKALMHNLREYKRELFIFSGSSISNLPQELTRKGSWLESDEKFSYIQQMAVENRIMPTLLSISDRDALQKLAAIIKENGFRLDTLYTSNVIEWLLRKTNDAFKTQMNFAAGMLPLIDQSSLYISSDQIGTRSLKLAINSYQNTTYMFFEFLSLLEQSA